MAQMGQYIITLSLKSTKMTSDFILNHLKKNVIRGTATTQKYQKQKPLLVLFAQLH